MVYIYLFSFSHISFAFIAESIPMARERDIFERLLKYGIECLEVFTISSQNNFMRNNMAQQYAIYFWWVISKLQNICYIDVLFR